MDIRVKILVVLLPFIVAGYVGMSMLQPALDDAKSKEAAVEEKNKENSNLETKLQGSAKVSQRQTELKGEIEKLRGSVPKTPDSDLLTIDLEKMCKDAGMNMISITAPKDSGNRPAQSAQAVEDATKKKQDKLKNMLKGGPAAADATSAAGGSGGPAGGELEHYTKQFTVSGDYIGMQKLVHELETYQRVVRIDDISFHLPKKIGKGPIKIDETPPADADEPGDPRLLFITMTLSSYYLP